MRNTTDSKLAQITRRNARNAKRKGLNYTSFTSSGHIVSGKTQKAEAKAVSSYR